MENSGKLSEHAGELEKIISAYYGDIYRFCCWKIHDPAEAQDMTQDTFIRFMEAAETYADIEKPKALLYTIAKNLCLNWIKRERALSLDAAENSSSSTADDLADGSIERLYLSDMISKLPDDQQEVLLLRYGQDLRVGEIAEILGLSRFQVMYRIRGALDRLRKSMGREK